MAKSKKTKRDVDTVVAEALDRFEESQGATEQNRREAEEDIRFGRLGEQWPAKVRRQREAEGRPVLTINRMPAFIRQVVNDSRQNKPSIQVVPTDSGADVDTAEVIGGLIRSIQQGSNAEVAYDTALEQAVSSGFGFFRICLDYVHEDSFDMEAKIERVANPLAVHWDSSTTKFDASDWEYGFVSEWITKAQFEQKYPGKEVVSFEGDDSDRIQDDYLAAESVRVAEYFLRSMHKRKIVQLSDGQVVREDELKKPVEIGPGVSVPLIDLYAAQGITPTRDRMADYYKVVRRVLSGAEVLEEEDWPGSTIPICPVWGDEVIVDGRRHFRSLIRDARDPQMMFNFWRSSSTELVALAPRAPFIAQVGAIPQGPEGEKWRTANTRSHPYLLHNAGTNPPQRQPFPGVPAGNIQEALNAADDMKAIVGIYDSQLGARSNETSGKAIIARQRESDNSTFHFIDNLSRAIQYCGRCLVEIIPSVYSQRETIRILGDDMAPKVVKLAQESAAQQGEDTPNDDPNNRLYDFTIGKYDVVVKTGPSFATKREEAAAAMTELIRAYPPAAPIMGDKLMEMLDFPGSQEIAKRMQKMLPPQLQDGQDGRPQGLPPEIQQQIQQGTELIEQLQQENAQLKMQAQGDQIDAQVKMQELQLKAREMELRATEAQKEFEIKVAELRLKEAEIMGKVQSEQASREFEAQRMDREDMRAQQAAQAVPATPVEPPHKEPDQGAILTASALQAVAAALEKVNAPRKLVRDPKTGAALGVEPA